MNRAIFTLSSGFLLAIFAFASCQKRVQRPVFTPTGLYANRVFQCDTVVHSQPMRMFTHDGEVSDRNIIDQYLSLHPIFLEESGVHPDLIRTGYTDTVYLNGLEPYVATLYANPGRINLRQKDTSMSSASTP